MILIGLYHFKLIKHKKTPATYSPYKQGFLILYHTYALMSTISHSPDTQAKA